MWCLPVQSSPVCARAGGADNTRMRVKSRIKKSSFAGHTYLRVRALEAGASWGRAQGKGGRGKNTYGVKGQVFVR